MSKFIFLAVALFAIASTVSALDMRLLAERLNMRRAGVLEFEVVSTDPPRCTEKKGPKTREGVCIPIKECPSSKGTQLEPSNTDETCATARATDATIVCCKLNSNTQTVTHKSTTSQVSKAVTGTGTTAKAKVTGSGTKPKTATQTAAAPSESVPLFLYGGNQGNNDRKDVGKQRLKLPEDALISLAQWTQSGDRNSAYAPADPTAFVAQLKKVNWNGHVVVSGHHHDGGVFLKQHPEANAKSIRGAAFGNTLAWIVEQYKAAHPDKQDAKLASVVFAVCQVGGTTFLKNCAASLASHKQIGVKVIGTKLKFHRGSQGVTWAGKSDTVGKTEVAGTYWKDPQKELKTAIAFHENWLKDADALARLQYHELGADKKTRNWANGFNVIVTAADQTTVAPDDGIVPPVDTDDTSECGDV